MNNKNFLLKSLKKYIFLLLIIMILPIILATLFTIKMDSNFWENYWATMASIISAMVAVIGVFYEINNNRKEKEKEEKNEEKAKEERIRAEKNQKFEEKLSTVNQEGSEVLIEWDLFLKSNQIEKIAEPKFKAKIVKLLYQYSELDEASKAINTSEESQEGVDGVSDVFADRVMLKENLQHKNSENIKSYIKRNFWDLRDIIETLEKEVNTPYPFILSDLILKEKYVNKVNYLVGVSNSTKEVIGIYQVDKEKNKPYQDSNGKWQFQGELIYDRNNKQNDYKSYRLEILDNWFSANNLLYYNHWTRDKEEKKREKLWQIISKYQVEGKSWNGERDIVVVKTKQFD